MTRDNGHATADTQSLHADLTQLHAALGHYARMLWDIQKTRIGLSNRIGAMQRDGLPEQWFGADDWTPGDTSDTLSIAEQRINRYLERLAKRHPMADWIAQAPGIGLPGFARLLAVTGPLDRFPTVSKLWKYLGLHTVDGGAPRPRKGEAWTHTNCQGGHPRYCKPDCTKDHHPNCSADGVGTAYAPQGRVVCHQLAESIVKVGKGKYREAYDLKKTCYEIGRPDWTQVHRHNAAMRYAIKELVKDLWIEWHRRAMPRVIPTLQLPAA